MAPAGHHLASMAGSRDPSRPEGNAIPDAGSFAAGILRFGVLESEFVSVAGWRRSFLYSAEQDELVSDQRPRRLAQSRKAGETGQAMGRAHTTGCGTKTVVPSAPDAWITALERYGTMGFADVAEFAIGFAGGRLPDVPHDGGAD